MDAARLTDERLRWALNTNQSSRERMCLAVLALDRSYSNIRPRRPEGGPDQGRDIDCQRLGERCFGAVGFQTNVSDSPEEKREAKKKFMSDLLSAKQGDPAVKTFVFFCNVDLTPGEVNALESQARENGFAIADIYWRERIRIALDSPEGLAIRFQYLSIQLSEAEQAAFFARFGKDLEDQIRGRFDRIEKKLDEIEYARWKAGTIRSITLDIGFKKRIESRYDAPYHFRSCLQLQSVVSEKRGILIGSRDDFWESDQKWFFDSRSFFWRERFGDIKSSWISKRNRVGGGAITGINLRIEWLPTSSVTATEFDNLFPHLYLTQNLLGNLSSVRLLIDNYLFVDRSLDSNQFHPGSPRLGWPEELTAEESAVEWRCVGLGAIILHRSPPPTDDR